MPRPKVLPQNRKRVFQACSTCRASKRRCDGQQPCRNCIRKSMTDSCVFEDVSPSSASIQSSVQDHRPSIPTSQNDNAAQTSTPASINPVQIFSPMGTSMMPSSPEASHRTQPRLLDNSRGEKVFVGGSASLAFLQLIRDTVSQSLGSSNFADHTERNHMFEEPHAQAIPAKDTDLSLEQQSGYVDSFVVATRGLIELHTKDQILQILHAFTTDPESTEPLKLAIARVILAIGAQCSIRSYENIRNSRSFFVEAQKQAFAGMIQDPSIEMVQLFLLMSFYMLGACQRNAAFMYIGVAARGAYVLGLHYLPLGARALEEENKVNRITWKSLFIMDTAISSILGRPAATSTQYNQKQPSTIVANGDNLGGSVALQANYELACLLDQRVQSLYGSDRITAEGARACLDQLNAWSTRLPPNLRLASISVRDSEGQEQVAGGLHVSCFYYFGVMLLSRPFLIVCITNRLAKARDDTGVVETELAEANAEIEMQEIAKACLGAATYMVQTCIETQEHGLLPDNMRLLKAWVFAAGLVLGFEMFTVEQSPFEIEEAFRGSCNILETLSRHSPQAAHYLDILSSFSEAIAARRRQAVSSRKHTGRPIVEKIMTFQPVQSEHEFSTGIDQSQQQANSSTPAQASAPVATPYEVETNAPWYSDSAPSFDLQDMMNEPFLNWDSSDFLTWDPFSRDSTI